MRKYLTISTYAISIVILLFILDFYRAEVDIKIAFDITVLITGYDKYENFH